MQKRGSRELRKGRVSEKGGLYFVTKTLVPGSIFSEKQRADISEAICHFRDSGDTRLYSFVVMPDHWHALMSLMTEKTLARLVQDINTRASYQTRAMGGSINWQEGFHDHKLRPIEKVTEIVRYIEANPVRKSLTAVAEDWMWSSANKAYAGCMDRGYLGHERW